MLESWRNKENGYFHLYLQEKWNKTHVAESCQEGCCTKTFSYAFSELNSHTDADSRTDSHYSHADTLTNSKNQLRDGGRSKSK